MKGNRSRDTGPELAVRRLLHRAGHRYRIHLPVAVEGLRIRPDITFTAKRIVVFIDGCYWHACPEHGARPRSNARYWDEKFVRNRARDRRDTALLKAAGWTVLRFWEHISAHEVAAAVEAALRRADTHPR